MFVSPPSAKRSYARTKTLWNYTFVTALLLVAMISMPIPYASENPGPTRDVLGMNGAKEMIRVESGATEYPTNGKLLLTTVGLTGGPGASYPLPAFISDWFNPQIALKPIESMFDLHQSDEDREKYYAAQMISSQEFATYAALTELGYTVPTTLLVGGVPPASRAHGILQEGDRLVALNGQTLTNYTQLMAELKSVTPGATVTVTIERDRKEQQVKVVTGDNGKGKALLGIYVDPDFKPPVKVDIDIGKIGGPSAGLIFSLGIIDKLTPGDLTGGKTIAGTGTIGLDGAVGAIGGIAQKMVGAQRDHAKWFLAPAANCAQVTGNVPAGLQVVKVATLTEALAAVKAIAADKAAGLPSCP